MDHETKGNRVGENRKAGIARGWQPLAVIFPLLLFLSLFSGCGIMTHDLATVHHREFVELTREDPKWLRVYEERTLVLIETHNHEEVWGYPIEVETGKHILLAEKWGAHFGEIYNVKWTQIDKAYLVEETHVPRHFVSIMSTPFDLILTMLGTISLASIVWIVSGN